MLRFCLEFLEIPSWFYDLELVRLTVGWLAFLRHRSLYCCGQTVAAGHSTAFEFEKHLNLRILSRTIYEFEQNILYSFKFTAVYPPSEQTV